MLYFSRWKTTLIWLAVLASVVFAFPNLLSQQQADSLPDWAPSKKITLGLDLQGGSYMLLQVERQDIIKDRLTTRLTMCGGCCARLGSAIRDCRAQDRWFRSVSVTMRG
jgi:preprotein translocase subunit SecD